MCLSNYMCVWVYLCAYVCVLNSEIYTEGGAYENLETLINLFNFAGGGLTTLSSLMVARSINGSVNSKY